MESDSDFYGDEDEVRELEARVAAFDPSIYWKTRREQAMACSSTPIKQKIKEESEDIVMADYPSPSPLATLLTQQLHNPYEGKPSCAKQLGETIDAFLSRLPPATTDAGLDRPWIYVANPFIPREDRGGEEAPAEFGAQLGRFVEGGQERLEMFGDMLREVQEKGIQRVRGGPTQAVVNREMAKHREGCKNDVLMLAKLLKVRTGKWMLFIAPRSVNEVWGTVARATVNNELGIAAKVAPRMEQGSSKERLICIYTYDFSDQEDIARVLNRLRQLRLVRSGPSSRPIYYKPDAYTYLGIGSGNPWGFRASIYSSSEQKFARMQIEEDLVPVKTETIAKVKDEPQDNDEWEF